MKQSNRFFINSYCVLMVTFLFLVACQPSGAVPETKVLPAEITATVSDDDIENVKVVPTNEYSEKKVKTEDFPLPNCGGSRDLAQKLGSVGSIQKTIKLSASAKGTGGVEVPISPVAKGKLELEIGGAYERSVEDANSRLYTIEMAAAPKTHTVYVIGWYEQSFSSLVEFTSQKKPLKAEYTFLLTVPKIDSSYEISCATATPQTNEPTRSVSPTDTQAPAAATAKPPQPEANLLQNASFEASPFSAGAGWSFKSNDSDATYEWSTGIAKTGRHSLHLNGSKTIAENRWPGWFSDSTFPIEANSQYIFSAWVFTPDGAGSWLSVDYLNADGLYVKNVSTPCSASLAMNTWQQLKLSVSPSDAPSAVQVRLGLQQCFTYSKGRARSIYYDDVFFGKTTP